MVNVTRRSTHWIVATLLAVTSMGCAYRLYPPVPPSEEHVKLVAKSPERYVIHVQELTTAGEQQNPDAPAVVHVVRNYDVPADGRVTIKVPSYRPYCGVYLFNLIKVGGGGDDALKLWEVTVLSDVRGVRTLSLKELKHLPMDSSGYHILRIKE